MLFTRSRLTRCCVSLSTHTHTYTRRRRRLHRIKHNLFIAHLTGENPDITPTYLLLTNCNQAASTSASLSWKFLYKLEVQSWLPDTGRSGLSSVYLSVGEWGSVCVCVFCPRKQSYHLQFWHLGIPQTKGLSTGCHLSTHKQGKGQMFNCSLTTTHLFILHR